MARKNSKTTTATVPGKSPKEGGWNWQIIAGVAGAVVAIGTLVWTVWKDVHVPAAIDIQQRVVRFTPDSVLAVVRADQNTLRILEEHQLGKPLFAGDTLTQSVVKAFDPSVIASRGQTVGDTSFLTMRDVSQAVISYLRVTGSGFSAEQAHLSPGETLFMCIAVKYVDGREVHQKVNAVSYRKGSEAARSLAVNVPSEFATIPGLTGVSIGAPPTQQP
jgi:hypothetical protein